MHQFENHNREAASAPTGDGQRQQTNAKLEAQVQERTAHLAEAAVAHQAEIAALRRAKTEITRLAEHMQMLLESTGEGIYGLDKYGLCTFINRA